MNRRNCLANVIVITLALSCAPGAQALVGESQPGDGAAAHTVMVLKRDARGAGFCSGVVIAPRVVLTAAHCVAGAQQVVVHTPNAPLIETRRVTTHPEFVADAIRRRVRSIDLALIETAQSLPAPLTPIAIDDAQVTVGAPFRIAGYGLRREGVASTSGQLRSGMLVTQAPLSNILLWARDGAGKGLGACTGDSGGPVFSADGARLVAITVWSTGVGGKHCGALTQAALLGPQRGWIAQVLQQWGAR